jgi:quinol monooxygenase YgiN
MFEATAKLKIREDQLEGFKQQAAEVMRQMRALDDKPLRYDWFLNEDGTECEVHEAYDSADSLLEHQRLTADAKMELLRNYVAGHTMAFYAEPSSTLAQALEAMGASYEPFSFFQGLESDAEVPDEVPA